MSLLAPPVASTLHQGEGAPPSRGRGPGRLPWLDVLRGLAVALVLARHALPRALGGAGIVGVTLFFTLSGFLISGVLVREVERTGGLSLRRFFRNRALRLGPALLLLLVAFAAEELLADRLGDRSAVLGTVLTGLTYTADLPLGLPVSHAMTHLWSLAVEEQFYLGWPFVLLVAVRRGRLQLLVAIAATAALGALVLTVALRWHDPAVLYTLPTTWALSLVAGAAVLVWHEPLTRLAAPAARLTVPCVLGLLAVLSVVPDAKERSWTYLVGSPVLALCAAVLVLRATGASTPPVGVTSWLRRLGTISYAVYLWDYLIVAWLTGTADAHEISLVRGLVSIPLAVLAGALSWRLVERHAAGWRAKFDARPPAPTSAAAGRP